MDKPDTLASCPLCGCDLIETGEDGIYACSDNECDTESTVTPSAHFEIHRWQYRSADPDYDPIEAWHEGVQVAPGHSLVAHEIRYHHHTRTMLLRKNRALVTAIDVPNATPENRISALRTVIREYRDAKKIAELATECGIKIDRFRDIADQEREHHQNMIEQENERAAAGNGPASRPQRNRYSADSTEGVSESL